MSYTTIRRRGLCLLLGLLTAITGISLSYHLQIASPIDAQATGSPAAGWNVLTSANAGSSVANHLTAVVCMTTTNCWAVGDYHSTKDQTLGEQYNGTSWSVVTTANTATTKNNYLTGIACTSSSNCWAVGYYCNGTSTCPHSNGPYNQTLIEQYNGTSWSIVTSTNTSTSADNYLQGVTCNSSSDCWAVGYACSTSDCISAHPTGVPQTLIEHYNGTAWSTATSANTSTSKSNYLTAVTCTSGSNCWAAGYYCNSTSSSCPTGNGPYDQTLTEQYNGTSWSVVTSANTSSSKENELNGITCTNSSNCWAAGYSCQSTNQCVNGGSGASAQPLIEHYDGTSWTVSTSPDPNAVEDSFLNGVTCTAATDCLAVGYYCPETSRVCDSSHPTNSLVEQWDGTGWYVEPSANEGSSKSNYLYAVSCAAPNNCMAAGYYALANPDQTLTLQYGGAVQGVPVSSAWTSAAAIGNPSTSAPAAPSPIEGDVNLTNGAVYLGASDVSIAGRGVGLSVSRSYNAPQSTGSEDNIILDSTCVTASNCWGVGYFCNGSGGETCVSSYVAQTLVEHYDGTSWVTVPSPQAAAGVDNTLSGVACLSASDCWAVGKYMSGSYWKGLSLHYDGTSWSVVAMASTGSTDNDEPNGIHCNSSSDCWAFGRIGATYYQTLIEHYNGTSWSAVTSANTSTTQNNYLFRADCPSSTNCWTVGYYTSASANQTLVEHYNGTSWSITSSPNTSTTLQNLLYNVACTSSSNCWAVGTANLSSGVAQTLTEQYNGTSWSIKTSANTSTSQANVLNWVFCNSSSDCWASDYYHGSYDQTLVEHYNGTSWSIVTSANTSTSSDNRAKAVQCTSGSDCWITGYYSVSGAGGYHKPLVEHYNGTSWSIPSGGTLNAGGSRGVFANGGIEGAFGFGWYSNVTMNLAAGSGTETITDETGTPVTFSGSGSTWTAPAYNASTLSANTPSTGNWTYTRWNGAAFVFNSSGQLTSVTDRNGSNDTTSYTYTSGKLSTITAPGGKTLTVTWTGSHVTQIQDPASQTVGYAYDTSGDLTQVTDQAGNHIKYTYDGDHDLLSM